MYYYISYDISETKLRNKLIKILKKFAIREQLSVFQTNIDTKQFNIMSKQIKQEIAPCLKYQDSILILTVKDYKNSIIRHSNFETENPDFIS